MNLDRHPKAAPIENPCESDYLEAGMDLFNSGKYWHAHEEWEHLWLGLAGDNKVRVQGLIMAAAMLVQYEKGVSAGVRNHHANVRKRLGETDNFCGWDILDLRQQLAAVAAKAEVGELGQKVHVRVQRAPN